MNTLAPNRISGRQLAIRGLAMVLASFLAGLLARSAGFSDSAQLLAISIFILIVSATNPVSCKIRLRQRSGSTTP